MRCSIATWSAQLQHTIITRGKLQLRFRSVAPIRNCEENMSVNSLSAMMEQYYNVPTTGSVFSPLMTTTTSSTTHRQFLHHRSEEDDDPSGELSPSASSPPRSTVLARPISLGVGPGLGDSDQLATNARNLNYRKQHSIDGILGNQLHHHHKQRSPCAEGDSSPQPIDCTSAKG